MRQPFWMLAAVVLSSPPLFAQGLSASPPGQSNAGAPAVEVGAIAVGYVTAGDVQNATASFGGRLTAPATPLVAVQFEIRFNANTVHLGLYGVRVRFTPVPDAPYYVFGGVAGVFSIPEVRHSASGTSERGGGISVPLFFNGGLGRRITNNRRWNMSLEGEVWATGGAAAVAGGVQLSFSGRRRP